MSQKWDNWLILSEATMKTIIGISVMILILWGVWRLNLSCNYNNYYKDRIMQDITNQQDAKIQELDSKLEEMQKRLFFEGSKEKYLKEFK